MANFDPYHAWLGIPQGTRPLNHYQLLGLPPFASEPPVIAEAAAAQIAKLKPHAAGPHGDAARRVADEIVQARAQLLNAAARASYDAQLRQQLGMPATAAPKKPGPAAPTRPAAAVAVPARPAPAMTGSPVAAGVPMTATPVGMPGAMMSAGAPMATGIPAAMAAPMAAAMPMGPGGVPMAAVPMAVAPGSMPVGGMPGMPAMGVPQMSAGPALRTAVRPRRRQSSSLGPLLVGGAFLAASMAGAWMYRQPISDALDRVLNTGPKGAVAENTVVTKRPTGVAPGFRVDADDAQTNRSQRTGSSTNPGGDEEGMPAPMGMGSGMSDTDTKPTKKATRAANKAKAAAAMEQATAAEKPAKTTVIVKSLAAPPKFRNDKASETEAATLAKSLSAARTALADRNLAKALEQLDLATLEATAADSFDAIERTRQVHGLLEQYWSGVREAVKDRKSSGASELKVGNTTALIVEITDTKLILRAEGKNREYALDKLPTNVARALAEGWFQDTDPAARTVMGTFLIVDPKGDASLGRQMIEVGGVPDLDVAALLAELALFGRGEAAK